jgi:HD-like signal output (HDOD) protein
MKSEKKKGMDEEQQIDFLKKIRFFEDFDHHELKQFLAVSRWLKVPAKTHIIRENNVEKVFYILVRGSVAVIKTKKDGKQTKLTSLNAGDCFGEMAMVSETKRTAGVVTMEESFILRVDPDIINNASVFLQLKFYHRFCEILVSRLIVANKRLVGKGTQSKEKAEQPQKSPEQAGDKPRKPAVVPEPAPELEPGEDSPADNENIQEEQVIDDLPPMPKRKTMGRQKMRLKILEQARNDLPVNPAVAAMLSPFLRGANDNTRKFSELISLDPVISAKVLQMANSSFYRRTTVVLSVPHAMVTVGIKQIQELLAQETIKIFKKNLFGGFSQLARSFWRHSVTVARIAELLRDIIRVNVSEDVYLAGLLHDFGILILDPLEPDFYPQLLRDDFKINLCEAEREFIGADHCQAGTWLGEKMGLPKPYLDVMKLHQQPEKIRDNIILTALVHLADLFADERGCCFGGKCPEVNLQTSFAWILLQDQHVPFRDVNVQDFINQVHGELDRNWQELSFVP